MISILTPSYNHARFLPDTLHSVAKQVAAEFEHVVVDDGSSDESVAILEAWREPLVFRTKANEGQSATLNAALALARGDWIGWLNSDDFYLPGVFAEIERHASTGKVDVIHGDAVYVDVDSRVLRLVPQHPLHIGTLARYGATMSPSSVFIRRELLADDAWDEGFRLELDWDLWLRLAHRGARFHYLPLPLSAFRWHSAQVSQNPVENVDEEWTTIARRYGAPWGERNSRTARIAGYFQHGRRKLTSGAYRRQWRVGREFKGADIRWFNDDAASRRVERLLELADGRKVARSNGARVREK